MKYYIHLVGAIISLLPFCKAQDIYSSISCYDCDSSNDFSCSGKKYFKTRSSKMKFMVMVPTTFLDPVPRKFIHFVCTTVNVLK